MLIDDGVIVTDQRAVARLGRQASRRARAVDAGRRPAGAHRRPAGPRKGGAAAGERHRPRVLGRGVAADRAEFVGGARRADASRARLRPRDERLRGHARVRLQAPRAAPGRLPGRAQAVAARAASPHRRLAGRAQRRSRERVLRPDRRALRARRRHRQCRRLPPPGRRRRSAQLRQRGRARLPRPCPRPRSGRGCGDPLCPARGAPRHLQQHRPARRAGQGRRSPRAAAEQLGDDAFRARAAGTRAAFALLVGDYAGVAAAAARAVALAESTGVRAAALSARINWGRALQFQGDYDAAQQKIEESLALARELGNRKVESVALGQLGIGPCNTAATVSAAATTSRRSTSPARSATASRERHDQQPRRDRAAARPLRRGARAVPGRPPSLRRDRPAPRRCLSSRQHGAERVPARRRRRLDRIVDSGDAPRRGAEGSRPAGLLRCVRGHAHAGLGESDEARRATRQRWRFFASSAGRPCRPSRSPGWPESQARAATSQVRWRRSTRSSRTSTPAARSTAPRIRSGSTSRATRCSPRPAPRARPSSSTGARASQRARRGARRRRACGSFLANVPTHRAVVAAWTAAGRAAT